LKLGGSAITRKEKPLTPRLDVIRRLAVEVAKAGVFPLLIVHGGGSYGHPLAKKYRITDGFKDSSQLTGLVKTHEAMTALNRLVVNALIDQGVSAFSMSSSSIILMKHDMIQVLETRPLTKALEIGLTPVLCGDVAFDSEKGCTILSGDKIVASLAVELGAKRIVMGVDVDGLFTGDPKVDLSVKLVRHLTLEELKSLQTKIGKAGAPDVTGGMFGKVTELATPIARGIEVVIVNALRPDGVYKALRGEETLGTKITKA
jgi:isopentenyl phosphate kinase